METFCPLHVDLKDRSCLVVGGGNVAARKVMVLLNHKARVTVVSPLLKQPLKELLDDNKFIYLADIYRPAYLQNRFLVICATSDAAVNRQVADDCLEKGIMVNSVSEPDKCTFYLPAFFKKGALTVTVSTSGSSPALARRIRNNLCENIDPAYAEYTLFLKEQRPQVIRRVKDEGRRKTILEYLAGEDLFITFKTRGSDQAGTAIESLIENSAAGFRQDSSEERQT